MKKIGFTLVELIVVMAVVGLLTGIILPVFLHGGLDEGVSAFQSAVLSAKTFAVTKRKQCALTLNADYYTGSNPLPCLLTIQDTGISTFKKQYRLPKYIRFWKYNSANFQSGTRTIYFEPSGISYDSQSSSNTPMDTVITLRDEKTKITADRTIIGNTCQIKK
ncbi:MAG: type II secretion system protein [Planctomycetota bacterium]|nr:type II secretion system protein [Planctomycetota bacterium]MDE2216718.1 type II secretion system protein [Planctomycetota bacterium]